MCKVVSKGPFMIIYCLDRNQTQEMRDKAADAFLPTLKFVLNWFVMKKVLLLSQDIAFTYDE